MSFVNICKSYRLRALTQEAFFFTTKNFCVSTFQPCEEKDRLRKVYVTALHELVEATRVLQNAQYGRNFWMPTVKISKLTPNTTALDRAFEDHRKIHGC